MQWVSKITNNSIEKFVDYNRYKLFLDKKK